MITENDDKSQRLLKIASEYDGSLSYLNESEILNWLELKYGENKDSEERKLLKSLIEEGRDFGSSDNWGKYSPDLVDFAKLIELLKTRHRA